MFCHISLLSTFVGGFVCVLSYICRGICLCFVIHLYCNICSHVCILFHSRCFIKSYIGSVQYDILKPVSLNHLSAKFMKGKLVSLNFFRIILTHI